MGKKKTLEEWKEYTHIYNPHIDVIKELKNSEVLCHCNDCNQNIIKKKQKLHQGCPICKNKQVVKGVNDLNTTAPHIIKYLKNKEDGYLYTKSASKYVIFKCPDCGFEKRLKINTVYSFGFSCPICGDGISAPNKFARALFLQLKNIKNLKFEYESPWTKHKRYDAYFEYKNKKYVVEIDGDQHFTKSEWGSHEKQIKNDKFKDDLAKENEVNIIRIPFLYKDDISKKIECFENNNIINELINNSTVNWDKCISSMGNNIIKEVCEYYSNHKCTPADIGEIFKLSKTSIRNYLKFGNKLNWCNYDKNETYKIGYEKIKNKLSYKIEVRDENLKLINIYDNFRVCVNELNKLYPKLKFTKNGIHDACCYMIPYKNFTFNYVGMTLQKKYDENVDFQKICEFYNTHDVTFSYELKNQFPHIGANRIRKYLVAGEILGVCRYSQKEINELRNDKMMKNSKYSHSNPLIAFDENNNKIGEFYSQSYCVNELNKLYPNKLFNRRTLSSLLEHKNECVYLDFKFIRKEKENVCKSR